VKALAQPQAAPLRPLDVEQAAKCGMKDWDSIDLELRIRSAIALPRALGSLGGCIQYRSERPSPVHRLPILPVLYFVAARNSSPNRSLRNAYCGSAAAFSLSRTGGSIGTSPDEFMVRAIIE